MTALTFPLSPAEFTLLYANSMDTDALQLLLDAAEAEIVERAGPTITDYVDRVETFTPRGVLLRLSEDAASIESVIEYAEQVSPTTLAADDYELSGDGRMLRRLLTGTNGAYQWNPLVKVTYIPKSDDATRGRVQAELVKLAVGFTPNLRSQTIGDWAEVYATSDVPYSEQRETILATLHPGRIVVF
jgi:hypothetical protein